MPADRDVVLLRIAGLSSLLLWLAILPWGVSLMFSFLGVLGLIYVGICTVAVVASVRVTRGDRRGLRTVAIGAAVVLACAVLPLIFVDRSAPESGLGWAGLVGYGVVAAISLSAAGVVLATGGSPVSRARR